MPLNHIATYLNDHLAGSAMALELLEHLATAHPSNAIRAFAKVLKQEIEADRDALVDIMARLHVSQSIPRKASAWISDKIARLKLRLDDSIEGPLHLLEAMELLSVGIEGKRLLWISLAAAMETNLELRDTDFEKLVLRAQEQRAGAEVIRLRGAKEALSLSQPI